MHGPPGTEKLIGEAIKASGVPREELFITTKLPYAFVAESASPCELIVLFPRSHHCGRVKEYFEDSLKSLGVDYVDLVGILPLRLSPYN